MLSNFFRINFPYGIHRDPQSGAWMAFNREYKPLGFYTLESLNYNQFPIHVKYQALTHAKLLKLAGGDDSRFLQRDEFGKIVRVWFYDDGTIPTSRQTKAKWNQYFEKLKILARLLVDDPPHNGRNY